MPTSFITIFTDGSSRGNPGPGGWGAVVIEEKGGQTVLTELGGGVANTTNNRMELTASLRGIEHTPKDSDILVYTDSSYLINGITKWVKGWKRNGWQTQTKQDVLNKDLWMDLSETIETRNVTWKYVGGHVGILGNERCDHIATAFADGRELKLYSGPLKAYDLPNILTISLDEQKATSKKSDKARSNAKAYSYISMIGGIIEVHHSWAECEKRVKGARGAKFRKSLDATDEANIIAEFEAL